MEVSEIMCSCCQSAFRQRQGRGSGLDEVDHRAIGEGGPAGAAPCGVGSRTDGAWRRFARRVVQWVAGWSAGALFLSPALAQQPAEVALAGFAYAGASNSIDARFPHSRQYEKSLIDAGAPIAIGLGQSLKAAAPAHLRIVDQIDQLKGRDQALAVALVISGETVVTEQFGNLHKLLVLIRGQAMFFDFKSMKMVRSYPLSFAYIDALNHPPSSAEIEANVRLVYEGAKGKAGLLTRFVNSVANASISAKDSHSLRVTSSRLSPEVLESLPAYIKSEPGGPETWLADIVSEAISTRAGVPVVPYAKGYAVGGVMSVKISDGEALNLKLPPPDYEIGVDLTGLKKIKFSEIAGGATTFVYGAYAQLRIEDALKKGLNTALKNGESRVIPASQQYVDDFPNFYDAINGLFSKLALVIDGQGDEKWLKGAAAAKDIDQQIAKTKELIKQCK